MSLLRPTYAVEVRRVMPTRPAAPARVGDLTVDPRAASTLQTVRATESENPLAKALQAVRKGLRWVINGPAVSEFKTRKVYDDPDTRWANATELRSAVANLKAKQGEEQAALTKLGARADGYRQMAEICKGDPIAGEALQRMLLDGRLTAGKDLAGKGDLFAHLARVATQPLAQGLDRKELLTSLIEEVDNPVKISQEGKGTCVATSATIVMTRKNAAEYARLVADLARPEGTTTTVSGASLQRHADWANDNDYGRTPSLRLLQPALMDLGNGFMRYNNDKDVHTLSNGSLWDKIKDGWQSFRDMLSRIPIMPGGLSGRGANKVLEALTGEDYAMIYMVTRLNRGSAFRRVEEASRAGKPVPVGLEWEGGGHKVVLDKIEGGMAYITNPWGQRETMGLAEFKSNLMDANIPR